MQEGEPLLQPQVVTHDCSKPSELVFPLLVVGSGLSSDPEHLGEGWEEVQVIRICRLT